MCLTVVSVDIGHADALIDMREGLLVVNARLEPEDQWDAARIMLIKAGVDQPEGRVTCPCGEALPMPRVEGVA